LSIYYKRGLSARFKRRLNLIAHAFYTDSAPDHSRSVLICGAGRSGTTWLAEVLNAGNEYRYLYEPFNREQVPVCRHFSARQYLRPDDEDHRYRDVADAVFCGKIRNGWIDQYNRRMMAQRRLIKDVRSTLMLKWIRDHYQRMPIVFAIRHPGAVAYSRVKQGWRTNLREVYFAQGALMADYLEPLKDEVLRAESPFERHLIDWCVENLIPFSQLEKGDVYLAPYENIRANPAVELEKMFAFFGRSVDRAQLKRLNRLSASSLANGKPGNISEATHAVDSWRKAVSPSELAFAARAVRVFGLDQIYGDSALADASRTESLFGNIKVLT
jgi:hypothetical protein